MRKGPIIVVLAAVSVIGCAAYFLVARAARCDEIVESPVRSPDGLLVATSTFRACPVGLLSTTTCSVSVAVSPISPTSSSNPTTIFESVDASEVPTLSWVDQHELRLRVNDIGVIQASKHRIGEVKISYTVPKWIWDKLDTFEADRVQSERQSQELFDSGKLSKDDLRASISTEEAMAGEHARFREWVLANATEDGRPQ